MKHKLEESRFLSITSDMQMTPPWWQKARGTKEPLDEDEIGEWKIWLKTQCSKNEKDDGKASGPITSWQIDGEKMETMADFISWAPKLLWTVSTATKLKMLAPWKQSYDKTRQHIKKQRHHILDKGLIVKAMVFPVVMYECWELNHKEGWALKSWCFWIVVLEKILESPLEIKNQGDWTSQS